MDKTTLLKSFLAAAVAGGIAVSAHAQVIFSDDFDSYSPGALGSNGGWTTTTANSATISTDQAASGSNSVFVSGLTTNDQRNQRIFNTTTGLPSASNIISFSFDFYDTNAAVAPYRQYANLQAGTDAVSGFLVSMGLNNNLSSTAQEGNYYMARIFGGGPAGLTTSAYFKLNEGGEETLRRTGWVNLRVDISSTEFNFHVDNILAKTVANTMTLRDYDRVLIGSGLSNGNNGAYYDNIMVQVIPEPSTYAAIFGGLALLGAFVYRRRVNAKQ